MLVDRALAKDYITVKSKSLTARKPGKPHRVEVEELYLDSGHYVDEAVVTRKVKHITYNKHGLQHFEKELEVEEVARFTQLRCCSYCGKRGTHKKIPYRFTEIPLEKRGHYRHRKIISNLCFSCFNKLEAIRLRLEELDKLAVYTRQFPNPTAIAEERLYNMKTRTTKDLRDILFTTIDELRAGKISKEEARVVGTLAERIIRTAELEVKAAFLVIEKSEDRTYKLGQIELSGDM